MINENHFNRAKIFYPFVVNYMATQHGILDLLSRGIVRDIQKLGEITEEKKEALQQLHGDKILNFIESPYLTPQLGKIKLKTIFNDGGIEVDINEISDDFLKNYNYLLPFQLKAAGSLIVMAYELTRKDYDDQSEIWNFLYHCRNGAAHGGDFPALKKSRFPAKWRGIEITQEHQETPLFHMPDKPGLLSYGDPLTLLWDIEMKYLDELPITKPKLH